MQKENLQKQLSLLAVKSADKAKILQCIEPIEEEVMAYLDGLCSIAKADPEPTATGIEQGIMTAANSIKQNYYTLKDADFDVTSLPSWHQ